MKASEIRQLSDEEIANEIERVRRHLFDLRSQAVTEKLEDPSMLTKAKRDIARLLTISSERALQNERSAAERNGSTADV